jgi:hypothetical protein
VPLRRAELDVLVGSGFADLEQREIGLLVRADNFRRQDAAVVERDGP